MLRYCDVAGRCLWRSTGLKRCCAHVLPNVSCSLWKLSQRWSDHDYSSRPKLVSSSQTESDQHSLHSHSLFTQPKESCIQERLNWWLEFAAMTQWPRGFFTWLWNDCQASFVDTILRRNSLIRRGRQRPRVWGGGQTGGEGSLNVFKAVFNSWLKHVKTKNQKAFFC